MAYRQAHESGGGGGGGGVEMPNIPLEIYELSAKPTQTADFQFKVILVGTSGVGKTQLVNRFCGRGFQESSHSTIGADFSVKYYRANVPSIERHYIVAVQLWDTAGQERYRAITPAYYRGAHVAVVVFSLTSQDSFTKVESHFADAQQYADDAARLICVLVGNKKDLCDAERQVSSEQWQQKAASKNIIGFETSAKTCAGVNETFGEVVRLATMRALAKTLPTLVNSDSNNNNANGSGASSSAKALPASKPMNDGRAQPRFDPSKHETVELEIVPPDRRVPGQSGSAGGGGACGC